ncbi:MAG: bifunctional diguanylate cyclase/phosphodiesterase [Rhodococcus sp. (in: high G+C Gram-positive bacteria)]|uniref:putative bifunctional diguanylate cyclase/phosphodiesterase n=1 Tax=Rhodococcus sp. TaxID=1831 RepID=UPI003BB80A5C
MSTLAAIASMLVQVQARIDAEEGLRRAAYHDALTDLASRRALLEHLESRLAPADTGSVGVIFLDLDRLKPLNDFLGHAAVDEYLCRTARRLSWECGAGDLVARLGGDEFVVVLAGDVSLGSTRERAESLRWAIGLSVQIGGQSVSRGGSFGVAVGEPGRISAVELLGRADEAMMVAKSAGGNSVVAFTDDMLGAGERRNLIELHLRTSIDDDHLTLQYQPVFDLATGDVLGVEALVRWNHPVLGTVQPGEFIGVAESTNLGGELGRWVLRTACEQLARWLTDIPGLTITMSVNVSPVQLVSVDFVESVEAVLATCGIPASSLCLEITEHVVVSDIEPTRSVLRRLAKLGVSCAIDDFGTGYSSLTHLKSLPVGTLKIDRGFVQGLPNCASDRVIVESVMGLASSFGLDVVAEGLETVEAARALLELGCRRAQGFLLGKPASADDVVGLLRVGRVELEWKKPQSKQT